MVPVLGASETRKKAVYGTFKSPATAADTSPKLPSYGRVSLQTDEFVGSIHSGWDKAIAFLRRGTLHGWGKAYYTEYPPTISDLFLLIVFLASLSRMVLRVTCMFRRSSVYIVTIFKIRAPADTDDILRKDNSLRAKLNSRNFFDTAFYFCTSRTRFLASYLDEEIENEKDYTAKSTKRKRCSKWQRVPTERLTCIPLTQAEKDKCESEYFHEVNSKFATPLLCAPYCDQIRYTKYDPDCSWTNERDVDSKVHSKVHKLRKKTKQPSRISSVNTKVTDDEFDELCSLIQDIGYVYVK